MAKNNPLKNANRIYDPNNFKDTAGEEDENALSLNNETDSVLKLESAEELGVAAKEAAVKENARDIKKFNIQVYEAITSKPQNYSVQHEILPGESCTFVLR